VNVGRGVSVGAGRVARGVLSLAWGVEVRALVGEGGAAAVGGTVGKTAGCGSVVGDAGAAERIVAVGKTLPVAAGARQAARVISNNNPAGRAKPATSLLKPRLKRSASALPGDGHGRPSQLLGFLDEAIDFGRPDLGQFAVLQPGAVDLDV
jgi:hypothetical protein